MSEYEGIHHRLEDRAPLPGEWSPETANVATFTDNRDDLEARLGNFLRNCCRVWHPSYAHAANLSDRDKDYFIQAGTFADQMRENAIKLLEELNAR